jgi:hypothetical protein
MAKARRKPKRNTRRTALALGAAGVSLAMTGGTSATAPTNAALQDSARRIFLGEEEIADVSLSTFHVFDKETESRLVRVAAGCGGHGGGGCGHGGGCGGCARAGGCGPLSMQNWVERRRPPQFFFVAARAEISAKERILRDVTLQTQPQPQRTVTRLSEHLDSMPIVVARHRLLAAARQP